MIMSKYEPGHFNQQQYIADFVKENYDEFKVRLPKGSKEVIKALAKQNHLSVNALITQSIERTYNIDLSKPQK